MKPCSYTAYLFMVLSTFTSISVLWDERAKRVIQQGNYLPRPEQEICGLSGKGAQTSLGVSHACSSFLVKAHALKVNLSIGSFAASWQNNEQLCIMRRRTCQKLTLQCGRRRRYQSLVTLKSCLLSPVEVGAQRYAGLRSMGVTVCFDGLATACLRLLNETAFLSLGVTRCYFFPHCWVRQGLAECAKRPGESECCVSRCLSLLGGWRFPAAWWQEVVGVHGLGVTAVLSDSWSCRVLQDRLCYWRQEALFPSAAWVTWQDWQPGEMLWQQLKAVPVDWHLRVKLNSSVFLWGNGI